MKRWIILFLTLALLTAALLPAMAETETVVEDTQSSATTANQGMPGNPPQMNGQNGRFPGPQMGNPPQMNENTDTTQSSQFPGPQMGNPPQMNENTDSTESSQFPGPQMGNPPQMNENADTTQSSQFPGPQMGNPPQMDGNTDSTESSQLPGPQMGNPPQMNGNMPTPPDRISIAALREQISAMEDGEEKDALIAALEAYEQALRENRPSGKPGMPSENTDAVQQETDADEDTSGNSLKAASEALLALLNTASETEE